MVVYKSTFYYVVIAANAYLCTMKYNLEDKPKLAATILYGLQWWIVAIPSIVILGLVVAKLHFGNDVDAQAFYMQKLFFIAGVTLLVQIRFGHKLPIVVGPASILLIGILASVSGSVSAIYTAIATGGLLITLVAMSGLLRYAHKVFTPRVIIVTILLIPLTLAPTIINLIFRNAQHTGFNLSFSLLLVFALLIGNKLLKGVWKSTTLLWGIIVGTLTFYLCNGLPTLTGATVTATSPVASPNVLASLFTTPEFDLGVIFSFLFCALVLTINEISSIQAVGQVVEAGNMAKRTVRGVAFTGVSNIAAGLTGVMGTVDYSMSPGIISSTGCASRFPFIPTAILLLVCSFFPMLVRGLSAIPNIVMGVILVYVMLSQFAAGLQMAVQKKAVMEFNDGAVIGLSMMVALLISFAPAEALGQIPSLLRPILGNGFVMGIITVLALEHLVYEKKKIPCS